MLAQRQAHVPVIFSQPLHVQYDPVGESRDGVFIRRFVGTIAPKFLPFQQTNESI
jgi:hypothetical protein